MSVTQVVLIGSVSFAIACILTFPLRAVGVRYGIVDVPTVRSSHRRPTVRIGGPAILVGTIAGLAVGSPMVHGAPGLSREIGGLLAGAMIVALVSLADDLFGLKAQYRLFAQVVGAVLFVGLVGQLRWIDLPATQRVALGPLSLPVTILWLVALTNIFNFMDGIDGLAAGVTTIACCFVAAVARMVGNSSVPLYGAVLAGSAAGFLVHNFPTARVFMGDAGSTFLGFMVGGIAVIGNNVEEPGRAVPVLAVCLMIGAFLFDTTMTMLRRLARRDGLFQPHRDYLFQRAVQKGLSPKMVTLFEYGLAVLLGLSALLYLRLSQVGSWCLVLLWTAVFVWFAERIGAHEFRSGDSKITDRTQPGVVLSNSVVSARRAQRGTGGRVPVQGSGTRPPGYLTVFALVALDLCLCTVSYYAAYVANFVGFTPKFREFIPAFYSTVWLILPCRLGAFWVFGLYRGMWRKSRAQTLFDILRAVAASTVLAALLIWAITRFQSYPRAVLVIDSLFIVYLVGFTRFVLSVKRERPSQGAELLPVRLLIVGGGKGGASIVREINSNPQLGYVPVCIVDDDPDKQGKRMHGVPVLGSIDRVPQLVREHEIDQVLIAIRHLTAETMSRIAVRCVHPGVELRIVPGAHESEEEAVSVTWSRELRIPDFFGRRDIPFDRQTIARWVSGKRVLVTGAGCSVGVELCRHLDALGAETIVLLDQDEETLYEAGVGLSLARPGSRATMVVADPRDREKLLRVFETVRPEVVFHLWGSNNVVVSETNCDEAVLRNAIGSKHLLESIRRAGSERVIVVSSTEAADPVSVMGCTKRIAEILVNRFRDGTSVCASVRLSNVVEDRTGIAALIEKQVAAGGPVTVGNPDMTRYFMTARDAARLLLVASGIANAGGLYCLDAGEPMRVVELAEHMVRLSGLQPHRDIEIKAVGLRSGERMQETPVGCAERRVPTAHPMVFELEREAVSEPRDLDVEIGELEQAALRDDVSAMLRLMQVIVPEFTPTHTRP